MGPPRRSLIALERQLRQQSVRPCAAHLKRRVHDGPGNVQQYCLRPACGDSNVAARVTLSRRAFCSHSQTNKEDGTRLADEALPTQKTRDPPSDQNSCAYVQKHVLARSSCTKVTLGRVRCSDASRMSKNVPVTLSSEASKTSSPSQFCTHVA